MRASRRGWSATDSHHRPAAAILEFAYDENTEQLYVTFSNGKRCAYFPLSARGFAQFYDAPARATHLEVMIKPRCHFREVAGIPRSLPRQRG